MHRDVESFVGRGNPLNKAIAHGEKLRVPEVETSSSKASISFCDSPVCILKRPETLPSQILNYSSLVQGPAQQRMGTQEGSLSVSLGWPILFVVPAIVFV